MRVLTLISPTIHTLGLLVFGGILVISVQEALRASGFLDRLSGGSAGA